MSTQKVVGLSELIAGCYAEDTPQFTAPILQEAMQRRAEAAKERSIRVCSAFLTTLATVLKSAVADLRSIRKSAKQQEENVKEYDRAFRFFAETGNPLPFFAKYSPGYGKDFCRQLEIECPTYGSDAWKIPEDWKPAQTEEEVLGT